LFRRFQLSAQFSGPVSVFHDRRLPETAIPAGYAALIDAYKLAIPVPRILSAIRTKHRIIEQGGWRIYTPRHAPETRRIWFVYEWLLDRELELSSASKVSCVDAVDTELQSEESARTRPGIVSATTFQVRRNSALSCSSLLS
jgi:hypothetical protein